MKKITSAVLTALILIACILALTGVVSAETDKGFPQITDFTGRLTDEQIRKYESELLTLKETYSYDAAVAIIDADTLEEYGYSALQDFADDLYDEGGYGVGDDKDGVLILLRIGEPYSNHFHLCTTGILVPACTEDDIDDMYYEVKPYLTRNDIPGAVEAAINAERDFFSIVKYQRTDEEGELKPEYDPNQNSSASKGAFSGLKSALIALAGGAGIGGITASSMKSKLKSVSKKRSAGDYVVPGSFNLTESRDMFLYTHVSKVAKPQDTGRSSGGGGGAGFHFSSSGVAHGGGTR